MKFGTDTQGWRSAGVWLLRIFAATLVIGSLASTTDFNQWWIRIWDFPRVQILLAMMASAIALWVFDRAWRPWIPLALLVACAWQTYRVLPYTFLAPSEVARVAEADRSGDGCFSMLTLNVLQKNREYDRTIELIERVDADIVLLTEIDQAWVDAVAPVLSRYESQLARPLDNTYGILFATRLPMRDAEIRDFAQEDTPSVVATLRVDSQDFRVIGLHPRPPQPKQDTEERDAELVMAARMTQDLEMPVMAIGDFNDVAWSDTTRLFTDIGGFLDPRIGRGTYASFPADMIWLGWPLDHLFVTEEFLLADMEVGDAVGSDHRPFMATMCLKPAQARALNEESDAPTEESVEEADEVMEEFREDSAKDAVEGEEG